MDSVTINNLAFGDGGRPTTNAYNTGVTQSLAYNNDSTVSGLAFSGAPIANRAEKVPWSIVKLGGKVR